MSIISERQYFKLVPDFGREVSERYNKVVYNSKIEIA